MTSAEQDDRNREPGPETLDEQDTVWQKTTVRPGSASPIPSWIGEYRIVRKIGEGGMGVVFEAEQQHPRRPVALKVILGGRYVDEHQVRLFQREAQTLARLKHPGIAAIYELGRTPEGQHFFTMELVRGDTLTEHLKKAETGDGLTRNELRRRLRLMQRLCEAVAYAHQRGVIHRDLKPANVLVVRDDRLASDSASHVGPQVKILDFGLARITDIDVAVTTVLSTAGAVQGTLPYMSPEQVRGNPDETDVRTDVYSLGVMLYEMLTGGRPFKLQGLPLPEAARVICDEAPARISRRLHGGDVLDDDIVTIALKAIEKDPAHRYQSASALADDIERYLTDQPIQAHPPSTIYQVRKLIARNRTAFGAGVSVLVLLVSFAAAVTVQARRLAVARDLAAQEAASARRVSEFLENLFQASDPFETRGRTPTAREILDAGARKIDRELQSEPRLRARLMGTIGSIYQKLGDYPEAERLLTAALASRKALLGDEHPEVADAEMRLGVVAVYEGKVDEARTRLQRSLEIRERVLPADDVDVGWSLYWLGAANASSGKDHALARRSLERAASIFEAKLGANHWAVSWCYNELGTSYFQAGDLATALSFEQKALAVKRAAYGNDHPDTAISLNNTAYVLTQMKDYSRAKPYAEEALAILVKAFGSESDRVASATHTLGELLRLMGDATGARQLLERAVKVAQADQNPDSPALALFLNSLALDLETLGERAEAEVDFRRALAIREKVLRSDDPAVAETLEGYSALLRAAGRVAEAEPMELRARGIRDSVSKHPGGPTTRQ